MFNHAEPNVNGISRLCFDALFHAFNTQALHYHLCYVLQAYSNMKWSSSLMIVFTEMLHTQLVSTRTGCTPAARAVFISPILSPIKIALCMSMPN